MAGIFKAYDIRGTYPDQLDERLAARIGAAVVEVLGAKRLVIGRDMRQSGPALRAAMVAAIADAGCEVIDIGECSTPMTYWAVNVLAADAAIMITASHNPAGYNGCKISGRGATPVSYDTGIADIERLAVADTPLPRRPRGAVSERDLLSDYQRWLLGFAGTIKPFKLVIDTGNGMMGAMLPGLFQALPCTVVPLYFEVDGSFPNHEPNPLNPANMRDLQAAVRRTGADLGAAFDGDGDRVMFVDERGELVPGDQVTALLAAELLQKAPGSTIIYDLRSSWAVPEEIRRLGGTPLESRVGHSFIKQSMRRTDAVFAGELSGHFYFRDAFFTDNAELAMLHVLRVLSQSGRPLSELMRPYARYHATGEVNFEVHDKDACLARLIAAFPGAELGHLDGLTLRFADWWCNVRPSNTEPVLRLNLEARTAGLRDAMRQQVEQLIGGTPAPGH